MNQFYLVSTNQTAPALLCNKVASLCDNPRKQLNKLTVTITQFLQELYTFDAHVLDLWPVITIYVRIDEKKTNVNLVHNMNLGGIFCNNFLIFNASPIM